MKLLKDRFVPLEFLINSKKLGKNNKTINFRICVFISGASVIRMLSHLIGESAFQNGLRSYVTNM